MDGELTVALQTTLTKLDSTDFLVFLDVKRDFAYTTSQWEYVDLCTIFELSMNEEASEQKYISTKGPVSEIVSNHPKLPLETQTVEGNPVHDFFAKHFKGRPTGEECKVPFLLCFGGKDKAAWRGVGTLTDKVLNTVDTKYSFTLDMGGNIEDGTFTMADGLKPTFQGAGA